MPMKMIMPMKMTMAMIKCLYFYFISWRLFLMFFWEKIQRTWFKIVIGSLLTTSLLKGRDHTVTLENASSCIPIENSQFFKGLVWQLEGAGKGGRGCWQWEGGGRIRWKWIRPQQQQQEQQQQEQQQQKQEQSCLFVIEVRSCYTIPLLTLQSTIQAVLNIFVTFMFPAGDCGGNFGKKKQFTPHPSCHWYAATNWVKGLFVCLFANRLRWEGPGVGYSCVARVWHVCCKWSPIYHSILGDPSHHLGRGPHPPWMRAKPGPVSRLLTKTTILSLYTNV